MEENEFADEKISNVEDKKVFDIRERAFAFAIRIVKLCQFLEKQSSVNKNLIGQLIDSAGLSYKKIV